MCIPNIRITKFAKMSLNPSKIRIRQLSIDFNFITSTFKCSSSI